MTSHKESTRVRQQTICPKRKTNRRFRFLKRLPKKRIKSCTSSSKLYKNNISVDIVEKQHNLPQTKPLNINLPKYTISFRSDLSQVRTITSQDSDSQTWSTNYLIRSSRVAPSELTESVINHRTTRFITDKTLFLCCRSRKSLILSVIIGLLFTIATIGITVGIVSSLKHSTTSTSTTSTTTTTTPIPTTCNCFCKDESWSFNTDYLVRWTFDNRLTDQNNQYTLISMNNPSFNANGYVNQAMLFNGSRNQFLYGPYISLANTSFTIEMWVKPTVFLNTLDLSMLGLCPTLGQSKCLHLVIRNISSNYYLYFGFFSNDCRGNTPIVLGQWVHVAFVFDITKLKQLIYVNGKFDRSCTTSLPVLAYTGNITIGAVPALMVNVGKNYYYGYLDHITITKRVKSACEIHEDATLVACFLFNNARSYDDLGPNSLQTNELSTEIVSSGYSQEAISFNGTSYFQISSLTGLGTNNKSYSIVLWIRPRTTLNNIIHVSSNSLGQGWCSNFLSLSNNGSIVANTISDTLISDWGPPIPMYPTWTHVAQTWSQSNGFRLYINGILASVQTTIAGYSASGTSNFMTLGNSLQGADYCPGTILDSQVLASFNGEMDDFRVYSRELSITEISIIYENEL